MRVKKFEAKNMKDALTMVKQELGPDAVILSARDNRKSFGLGGEASVEITAAVSESTLQKKRFVESRLTANDREKFAKADARTQRQIISKMVDRRLQEREHENVERVRRPITSVNYIDIPDEHESSPRRTAALEKATGRNVRELLEGFEQDFETESLQQRAASGIARATTEVSEKALSRIRSAAREAWQAGIFTNDEKPKPATGLAGGMEVVASSPVAPSPISAAPSAEIATLKGEIERLQKMLEGFQKVPQSFATMHPGADFGIPYDLSFMFQKLTDAGVTVDNAVEILQKAAKEIDPLQMKKRPIVDAWVARYFLGNIHTVQQPFQGRLHLFVGASGSGKTSTLVKLASHLVVKEKKKIAVLTTDCYKVGAVDQLKIYGQILNVPFAVIRSRKDWEWVFGQLHHVDHVLVDFPGFQLRDLDEIHLFKSLLPPQETAPVCHLCMSATTKDGDAYEIARRYKVADFSDLVFTGLDQSVQHGIIYNLQKKTGKALHSFGIGNRIPEDFEIATKERVLDLIFKLTKLRRETK